MAPACGQHGQFPAKAKRMESLKSLVVKPLQSAALAAGLSRRVARRMPVRRVVMLHGVGPGELEVAAFVAQMEWLARNFRVVSLDELIAGVSTGAPAMQEVALTFDDGLRCHAEIVAPVLSRLGLPATFFVCPGLMSERRWLWNHEVRVRLHLLDDAQRRALAMDTGAPGPDVEPWVEWMKTLPVMARQQVEALIRARTSGFVPTPEQHARFDPVSWEQLRTLDSDLFTVGSHTSSHPILTTLDQAELESELRGSRDALERFLGKPVDLFCYPNGSQDRRVRETTAKVYRAAVTTESGFVGDGEDLHDLPRFPVADSVALFAWRMHRPQA